MQKLLTDYGMWAFPGVTLLYIALFHHAMPLWDHLDLVPFVGHALDGALTWGELMAAHGGHWHVGGYVFLVPTVLVTGWSTLAECLWGFAWVMLAAILLLHFVRMRADYSWHYGALVLFFLFSLDQAANWIWGWQISLFMTVAGVVIVITSLCGHTLGWRQWGYALFGCIIAIYNFSTGLALLPIAAILIVLYPVAWPKKRLLLVAWIMASAAIISHYAVAVLGHTRSPLEGVELWHGIGQGVLFVLYYIASPITRFADDLAIPFALLGCGGVLWCLWKVWQEKLPLTLMLPWLAMIAFAVGAALLTAPGRIAFGADQAFVSRYITFGNFFWLGLILLWWEVQRLLPPLTRKRQKIAIGCVIVICAMKLGNAIQVSHKNAKTAIEFSAIAETLAAEHPMASDALYEKIYYDARYARERIDTLQAHGLSLFNR